MQIQIMTCTVCYADADASAIVATLSMDSSGDELYVTPHKRDCWRLAKQLSGRVVPLPELFKIAFEFMGITDA